MSYSESPDGKVVLTMSRIDYEMLLMALGATSGTNIFDMRTILELLNRLNEGNPHYTPYQIPEKK